MHESLHILLDLVIPEGLKAYFELKDHKSDADNLHLYLEEINSIPEEFKGQRLESKGFFEEVTLQDFPIRGRNVFLHIKYHIIFPSVESGDIISSGHPEVRGKIYKPGFLPFSTISGCHYISWIYTFPDRVSIFRTLPMDSC